jgi:hypothetical protein
MQDSRPPSLIQECEEFSAWQPPCGHQPWSVGGFVSIELALLEGSRRAYVVAGLIHLISSGILGRGGTAAEGCVVVLGNLLVSLLAGGGTGTLDCLRDVVGGVPEVLC